MMFNLLQVNKQASSSLIQLLATPFTEYQMKEEKRVCPHIEKEILQTDQ